MTHPSPIGPATDPGGAPGVGPVDVPDPDPVVVAAHRALHADALTALAGWSPPDPAQAALREGFLGLLLARPDATARACVPGHLTASAIVLSADHRSVLLTLHPRVGRWVQLGGHCEPGDATLLAAATREAREESGLASGPGAAAGPEGFGPSGSAPAAGLRPVAGGRPVHLDIHPITCSLGRPTRHFDVRYAFTAPEGAVPVISDESMDLRFWPVDDLPAGVDDGVRRAVDAALRGA